MNERIVPQPSHCRFRL